VNKNQSGLLALPAMLSNYLVSDVALPFLSNHPRTRSFPSLAAAIAALR